MDRQQRLVGSCDGGGKQGNADVVAGQTDG